MRNVSLKVALLFCSCVLASTNDVVQCWSITKSGNRCKRRAVANERYCKQHAADRTSNKQPNFCRSMTTNGVQCAEKPMTKRNYCQRHLGDDRN